MKTINEPKLRIINTLDELTLSSTMTTYLTDVLKTSGYAPVDLTTPPTMTFKSKLRSAKPLTTILTEHIAKTSFNLISLCDLYEQLSRIEAVSQEPIIDLQTVDPTTTVTHSLSIIPELTPQDIQHALMNNQPLFTDDANIKLN